MSSEEKTYRYFAYMDGAVKLFKLESTAFVVRSFKVCVFALCVATIICRCGIAFAAGLHDGMVEVAPPAATASEDSIPAVPVPVSDPLNSYYDDVMDEAEDSYLDGDTKLACEALLCLSSGNRPHECGPSLSRYFGIHKRKWKNTLKARRNFLRLCPSATADSQMESLVEVIVNGAGRCNASELNRSHWTYMPKRICEQVYDSDRGGYYTHCYEVEVRVIDPRLPSYCTNYNDHGYTYEVGVHYVGAPLEGGHWVDDSEK